MIIGGTAVGFWKVEDGKLISVPDPEKKAEEQTTNFVHRSIIGLEREMDSLQDQLLDKERELKRLRALLGE